jgi:hypothetical protein
MSRRAFYIVPLVALIVVGLLLAAGAFALHNWAWSQGYMAGQLAATGKEMSPPPFGYPMRPFGARGFLCLPTLLFVFGGFALLGMIGKWIHMWTWHGAMRRHGRKAMWWGPASWHWHHGPVPPWCWEWPEEKPTEDAPQAESPETSEAAEA